LGGSERSQRGARAERRPGPSVRRSPSRLAASRLAAGAVAALALAAGAHADDEAPTAAPAPGWEAPFQREAGWTGADACYSVDLRDGRTLWLFGDTWVGPVADGARPPGATLVHNSIAVHPTPAGREPPAATAVEFAWGGEAGSPAAWIAPPGGEGWYWPQDAVVADDGRLLLFLVRVGRTEAGGTWGFELLGSALAVVADPSGPPAGWDVDARELPHATGAPAAGPERPVTTWGAAVLLDGGWLHVYGIREGDAKGLLLARVRPDAVARPAAWRFWDGAAWTGDPAAAAPVARGLVNELSVDRRRWGWGEGLVMVHSEPDLGTRIAIRTADRPEGPWSSPRFVHDAAAEVDAGTFAYAAKGHPHLSGPGELLVSYVVNAHDLERLAADAGIYRPRFVRVDLSPVSPPRWRVLDYGVSLPVPEGWAVAAPSEDAAAMSRARRAPDGHPTIDNVTVIRTANPQGDDLEALRQANVESLESTPGIALEEIAIVEVDGRRVLRYAFHGRMRPGGPELVFEGLLFPDGSTQVVVTATMLASRPRALREALVEVLDGLRFTDER